MGTERDLASIGNLHREESPVSSNDIAFEGPLDIAEAIDKRAPSLEEESVLF